MKRRLSIALIVILNLGLLFIAMLVEGRIEVIQQRTFEVPHGFITLASLVLIICIMLLLRLRTFRKNLWKVSFGLAVMLTQLVTYSIFNLNQSKAAEGEYITASVEDANWFQDGDYSRFTVNLKIYGLSWFAIEVAPEVCVKVDSMELRIDEGFFGLKVASNDIRIIEQANCEVSLAFKNFPLDSANHLTYHFDLGDEYMDRRCFDNAIQQFSACILSDSLESKYYNRRARVHLTKRDFENALIDYYLAARLEIHSLDSNFINFVDTVNYRDHVEQFFARTRQGDYEGLGENVNRIDQVERLSTYRYWIDYCYEQINLN